MSIVCEEVWPPKPKKETTSAPSSKKIKRAYRNEAELSKAVIGHFNRIKNVKCQKIKGTAYGSPTLDILGSRNGKLFWLEMKQPGEVPTDRQYQTMKEWIGCGAIASWTDSVEGAMLFLFEDWTEITETKMLEGFHG
jgi:hypothetical protein